MIYAKEIARVPFDELGIIIKPAKSQKRIWDLSKILIHKEISHQETGTVVFIACDKRGLLVKDVEFIVGWQDIITYPALDYRSRFCMKLDRVYDPNIESGPYWGGLLEDGIADEVFGFGVPKGFKFDIKIIYTQCKGGA